MSTHKHIDRICAIAAGAAVYLGGALLFRFPEIEEIRNIRK